MLAFPTFTKKVTYNVSTIAFTIEKIPVELSPLMLRGSFDIDLTSYWLTCEQDGVVLLSSGCLF